MPSRRDQLRFDPRIPVLERRDLLSHIAPHALSSGPPVIHPFVALEPNGQHQGFVNVTNNRRAIATNVTHRINEAFQAFAYHALNVPITLRGSVSTISGIPVGTTPHPPTLANDLALLNQQVTQALATRELVTTRVPPSVSRGPKFTPLAQDALIPFAQAQIDALGGELATHPSSLKSVDAAYDAILDAVAENAVHPKLFRAPGDFYNNPATSFTIQFDGDPVGASSGFYTHGPGGVLLRGG